MVGTRSRGTRSSSNASAAGAKSETKQKSEQQDVVAAPAAKKAKSAKEKSSSAADSVQPVPSAKCDVKPDDAPGVVEKATEVADEGQNPVGQKAADATQEGPELAKSESTEQPGKADSADESKPVAMETEEAMTDNGTLKDKEEPEVTDGKDASPTEMETESAVEDESTKQDPEAVAAAATGAEPTAAAPSTDNAVDPSADAPVATDALSEKLDPLAAQNGVSAPAASAKPSTVANTPVKKVEPAKAQKEEWEEMTIPESWRPRPLLSVGNIPEGATVEEVTSALEQAAVSGYTISVQSLAFLPMPVVAAPARTAAGAADNTKTATIAATAPTTTTTSAADPAAAVTIATPQDTPESQTTSEAIKDLESQDVTESKDDPTPMETTDEQGEKETEGVSGSNNDEASKAAEKPAAATDTADAPEKDATLTTAAAAAVAAGGGGDNKSPVRTKNALVRLTPLPYPVPLQVLPTPGSAAVQDTSQTVSSKPAEAAAADAGKPDDAVEGSQEPAVKPEIAATEVKEEAQPVGEDPGGETPKPKADGVAVDASVAGADSSAAHMVAGSATGNYAEMLARIKHKNEHAQKTASQGADDKSKQTSPVLAAKSQMPAKPSGPPTDALSAAVIAAEALKTAGVTLNEQLLTFEAGRAAVQLYVGNVAAEFADADAMRAAMEEYGKVERAFIMLNPMGESKDYGFVEFSLPTAASDCKAARDLRGLRSSRPSSAAPLAAQPKHAPAATAEQKVAAAKLAQVQKEEEVAKSATANANSSEPKNGVPTTTEKASATNTTTEGTKEVGVAGTDAPEGDNGTDPKLVDSAANSSGENPLPGTGVETAAESATATDKDVAAQPETDGAAAEGDTPAPAAAADVGGTETAAAATPVAAKPQVMPRIVDPSAPVDKQLQVEWASPRTVAALFSCSLYLGSLKSVVRDERTMTRVLENYGPVKHVHIGRDKQTNVMRAFGFATFMRSADADKAMRALQQAPHPVLGRVMATLANPLKTTGASDRKRDREPDSFGGRGGLAAYGVGPGSWLPNGGRGRMGRGYGGRGGFEARPTMGATGGRGRFGGRAWGTQSVVAGGRGRVSWNGGGRGGAGSYNYTQAPAVRPGPRAAATSGGGAYGARFSGSAGRGVYSPQGRSGSGGRFGAPQQQQQQQAPLTLGRGRGNGTFGAAAQGRGAGGRGAPVFSPANSGRGRGAYGAAGGRSGAARAPIGSGYGAGRTPGGYTPSPAANIGGGAPGRGYGGATAAPAASGSFRPQQGGYQAPAAVGPSYGGAYTTPSASGYGAQQTTYRGPTAAAAYGGAASTQYGTTVQQTPQAAQQESYPVTGAGAYGSNYSRQQQQPQQQQQQQQPQQQQQLQQQASAPMGYMAAPSGEASYNTNSQAAYAPADISAQQTQYAAAPQGGQYASAGMAQPAYGMSGTAAGTSDYGGYAQQQATSVSDYATAQTASYGSSAYVAAAPVVNQTGYAPADVVGQVQDSQVGSYGITSGYQQQQPQQQQLQPIAGGQYGTQAAVYSGGGEGLYGAGRKRDVTQAWQGQGQTPATNDAYGAPSGYKRPRQDY